MRESICRGMAAAALVAGMTLPLCAQTAYADIIWEEAPETIFLREVQEASTGAVALSEAVALAVAGATLLRPRRKAAADDPDAGNGVTQDDKEGAGEQTTATSQHAEPAAAAGEDPGDGTRDLPQTAEERRRKYDALASRLAYAAWAMCKTLKWLMPAALLLVWARTGLDAPPRLGSFDNSGPWISLLACVAIGLLAIVCSVAYLGRCSALSKELSSSVGSKPGAEIKSMLNRQWRGVIIFSGGLLCACSSSGFLRASDFLPIGFALYAAVILVSSAPLVIARLGCVRKAHPEWPAWRIVLSGIGLTLATLGLAVLGLLVFVALCYVILGVIAVSQRPPSLQIEQRPWRPT